MHYAMRVAILLTSLLALISMGHAFLFYNKKSSSSSSQWPPQGYSVRSEQFPPWAVQPAPQFDSNGQITVALPVAVPIHTQMAPAAPMRNIQLVPCLCPVAKDIDASPSTANPSGAYMVQSSSSP